MKSLRKAFSVFFFLTLISVVVVTSTLNGWWIPNEPSHDEFPLRGIDVSHHNGHVNWDQVAAKYNFAFIKATEGSDWIDKRFSENWKESQKAGVLRGAYHFFSTTSSGQAQAKNFIATVPKEPKILPAVIDVEFKPEQSRMTKEEFLFEFEIMRTELREHYGQEPIIYTDPKFYPNYLTKVDLPRVWMRNIVARPAPSLPEWMFWQYSSRGQVDGISGRTDLNVFRGEQDELEHLTTSTVRSPAGKPRTRNLPKPNGGANRPR
ncbi:MAG: hypothetical protein MI807_06345 [Verrucomicrobiales bacterium]|nr:hypothetical protein [Verrucomicrobiales bacterium]